MKLYKIFTIILLFLLCIFLNATISQCALNDAAQVEQDIEEAYKKYDSNYTGGAYSSYYWQNPENKAKREKFFHSLSDEQVKEWYNKGHTDTMTGLGNWGGTWLEEEVNLRITAGKLVADSKNNNGKIITVKIKKDEEENPPSIDEEDMLEYSSKQIEEYVEKYGVKDLDQKTKDAWFETLRKDGKGLSDTAVALKPSVISQIPNPNSNAQNTNVSPDLSTPIVGVDEKNDTIDSTISGAQDFISSANTSGTIDQNKLSEEAKNIYNIFFAVGMVIVVVCGIALGIRFMTQSAEGKAEVKQLLVPYLIGTFIIFGAFGIWKIIIEVVKMIP